MSVPPVSEPTLDEQLYLNSQSLLVFQRIFEALPIPTIFVDREERILFLNQAYASYLQVNAADYIGKNIRLCISNSRIPMVLKTKKAVVSGHHVYVDGPAAGQEAIASIFPVVENGEAIAAIGMVVFQKIADLLRLTMDSETLQKELDYYKKELASYQGTKYSVDAILGTSTAVRTLKREIEKMANSKSTVLIEGESGSGKELVAHSIHSLSMRGPFPFVRVNCAAIPESLCEAEFFGYVEGAFTGAKKGGAAGKFEMANRGTLFLDEIGELPLFIQAKLLRVLQEKEISRIGSSAVIPLDVRVLAATNRNLEQMVRDGLFRGDLFYRLNILNIRVPPLRERTEDLDVLLLHYMEELYRESGRRKTLSAEAVRFLKQYAWPGNVRELSGTLEKMYYTAETDVIGLQDIPPGVFRRSLSLESAGRPGLDNLIEALEDETVSAALESADRNLSRTAQMLQISRPRLYRILERQKKKPPKKAKF